MNIIYIDGTTIRLPQELADLIQQGIDDAVPCPHDFDEERIDIIGQNGNEGLHYDRTE